MNTASPWLGAALLAVLALVAARGARGAEREPQPDAQMLVDLELLRGADLPRDQSFLTRMRLFERLWVLEALPVLESQSQTPLPAPVKAVK